MNSHLSEILLNDPDALRIADHTASGKAMRDMDSDAQPREKALKHGCSILSTSELWAIILRTGTPGFPITSLARQLMAANQDSLHRLERRSRAELLKFKGIGITKAIQIEAVLELTRRYGSEIPDQLPKISGAKDVAAIMKDRIGNLPHEEIWVLLLNRANRVVAMRRTSTGGSVASVFDLKMILKHAILEDASSLILTHNHPSGNTRPSPADDSITQKCKKGCEALDIRFLDHVIVTAAGYYSYSDSGRV
ncbi:MAG: DNA repair protein RadC [Bacteroidales bacterium]|nr:DNA repair protein RadC [Bacteroidales bacterium]